MVLFRCFGLQLPLSLIDYVTWVEGHVQGIYVERINLLPVLKADGGRGYLLKRVNEGGWQEKR